MAYLLLLVLISTVAASTNDDRDLPWSAFDDDLHWNVLDHELCQRHLQEQEAFEFFDASFRIPQSMLKGNVDSLGKFQQCLGINQPLEEGSIRGKYCLIITEGLRIPILTGNSWPANVTWVDVKKHPFDQNFKAFNSRLRDIAALDNVHSRSSNMDTFDDHPLVLGLCVPRSCSVHDVLEPLTNSPLVEFDFYEAFCRLPDDKPYSKADLAAVVVFSVIGFLTLISTAYELYHIFIKKDSTKPNELWSSFSVYGNSNRLMTLDGRPGALDCVDGIRSLAILWIIFGHTVLVYFSLYVYNMLDFFDWASTLKGVVLYAANISVDTFFTLSGLLLVYTKAGKMKQMQLVKSLHVFYLHRLLRMFPLLAAAVLLQASVLFQVSDGVRWHVVANHAQMCRNYWWNALLHIQNFVNPRDFCLPHTWYLAVDIQLHILSPLLLFWVLGSRRSAWIALAAGVLASLTGVIIYCFIKEFDGEYDPRYVVDYYQNTFARSPVFIIGMVGGYILHIRRNKKIKMSPWLACFGHAVALLMLGFVVYTYHVRFDWENQTWINLDIALIRSLWAIPLCWLIIACVHGYLGPINWFLSLKLWKFVARISYAMYLLHFPLQYTASGANSESVYFSMENTFIYFANDVVYAVIVSVALCVLIDAPFGTLFHKMIMLISPKKTPSKPAVDQTIQEPEEQAMEEVELKEEVKLKEGVELNEEAEDLKKKESS